MKSLLPGAAALLAAAAPPPATADDLGWMAGEWTAEHDGSWTEERWSSPRGGVLLGTSRTVKGGAVREFEFLRLQPQQDGTLAYVAQPGGAPPVFFPLVRHGAFSATFENPTHDYPQRISYAREGASLTATISSIDGSKAISWTLTRR